MSDDFMDQPAKAGEYEAIHRRMNKPRRISREEAIQRLQSLGLAMMFVDGDQEAAINYAIRALKREQKAADAKKKEAKR